MADTEINPSDKNKGLIVEVTQDDLKDATAAKTEVQEQFLNAQSGVTKLKSELSDIQNQLLSLIKNYNPEQLSGSFDKIKYTKTGFPSVPDYVELILSNAWPTLKPVKPGLSDIGPIDWSIITPPPPEALKTYFSHISGKYSSEIRAQIVLNAINDLRNGGNGIPAEAYAALLDRERNTRLRNQSDALREAMFAASGRGLGITERDGLHAGIISEHYKAQIHADQDAHNNIVALDFEYSVRAKEFAHNYALEVEKMLAADFNATEDRSLEISKAEFELLLSANTQAIEIYIARWQGIVSQTERIVAVIEGHTSLKKSEADMYVAEWDGYKSNVEGVAAENSSKLQQRSLQLQNKQLEVGLAVSQRQENRADAEFDLRQELAELETELKVFGINLDGYKSGADLTSSVLGTISKVLGQLTASTLGVTSASASMSFNGSNSLSTSKSFGASLSESYPDQSAV